VQADKPAGRKACRQTSRKADTRKKGNVQADKLAGKQASRQTGTHA